MTNNHSKDSQKSTGAEQGGAGNFANDPQRASEAGRKGGQQSQGTSHKRNQATQQGDTSHESSNKDKGIDEGRKSGQHSHGNSSKE